MAASECPPEIRFDGERMIATFDRFDLPAYRLFLKLKALPESRVACRHQDLTYTVDAPARYASRLGVARPAPEVADLPLPEFLFDDQKHIVGEALDVKRYAAWTGCGSGKTLVGLTYARAVHHRTGGRCLITTINDIVPQWVGEAKRFYGDEVPLFALKNRAEMRAFMRGDLGADCWCAVTNYEKWNPDEKGEVVEEARLLSGVIMDESSRLKAGGGRQKWAIIKSCRGIEYKLSLTATPAPNELMEFASQASFLEKMRDQQEIIWTFFRRDEKTHRWTVKSHAREAFYRFLANWSIYVDDPKRYGWRLDQPDVPPPEEFEYPLEMTPQQQAAWMDLSADESGQRTLYANRSTNAIQRLKLSQVAKGFRYLKGEKGAYDRIASPKPDFIADLCRDEVARGLQVLIWTQFDAEADLLAEALARRGLSAAWLSGKTTRTARAKILDSYRRGEVPILGSKPSLLGWGMNLQCAGSMIFSGWSDSFEAWFQAIRRAYRYGQKLRLRVHVPVIRELEGDQLDNIRRKAAQHDGGIREMESYYLAARAEMAA